MAMAEKMDLLAGEVIASYEARVASVAQIIEATHDMLDTFRRQREAMRVELRDTLARAASLRRRDFDAMMRGLLARQEERERAIKETIRTHLQDQRALAAALREALAGGEGDRIGRVRGLLKQIAAKPEDRERKVRELLAGLRGEQEDLAQALGRLFSNGTSIKVKEFKATLRAIQGKREPPPGSVVGGLS